MGRPKRPVLQTCFDMCWEFWTIFHFDNFWQFCQKLTSFDKFLPTVYKAILYNERRMTLTGLPKHCCSFLLLLWTWLFLLISDFVLRMARQHCFDCKLPWLKLTATQPFLDVYTQPKFTSLNSHLQPGWMWNKEDSVWSLHPTEKHLKLSLPSESDQSCLSSCKHMQQYKKDQEGKETFLWHEWHEPYSVRHLLSSGLPVYPCDPLCIFVLMQSCVWIPLLPDGLIGRFASGKKVRTLHFKTEETFINIQGKHQQKSAKPALQGDQEIFCTSKSRISNVYHTI